jgi:isocitrate/isopropylmalate dehydrogenase
MSTNRRSRLGVMLGDGIGPEIVPASVRVVDAALAAAGAGPVDWHELPLGAAAIEQHGSAIPRATVAALSDLDGWLLGPHDSAANLQPGGQITSSQEVLVEIHRPGDRPEPVAVPAYCASARVFQNRCS